VQRVSIKGNKSRSLIVSLAAISALMMGGCGSSQLTQDAEKLQTIAQQEKTPKEEKAELMEAPEITSEEAEGFHDLILFNQNFKELSNGIFEIQAAGLHKGKNLGVQIIIGPDAIKYCSTGADSDAFLTALDEIYETKISPKSMAKETEFKYVALEGDPANLSNEPVMLKLFYEAENADDVAEVFTNIDVSKHRLEFHEKDPDYRKPLINALRAKD
jgi:hypothetical protein